MRRDMTARALPASHVAPKERGAQEMSGPRKVRAYRDPHVDGLARGLGWFSVGLGIAQILAPRTVCRIVGLPPTPAMTRLCGLRELACGIGIITQRNPSAWLKARVAGDVMDLAGLAVA